MYKVLLLGKVPCPHKVVCFLLLKPQAVRIVDFAFSQAERTENDPCSLEGRNKLNSKLETQLHYSGMWKYGGFLYGPH